MFPFKDHTLEEVRLKLVADADRIGLDANPILKKTVDEFMRNPTSWSHAQLLEFVLLDYRSELEVDVLLKERLYQGSDFLNHKRGDPERDRIVLKELVSREHTEYALKRAKTKAYDRVLWRVFFLFVIAIIWFFTPSLFGILNGFSSAIPKMEFTNLRGYYIYNATGAGFMGASFSILVTTARMNINEVELIDLRSSNSMRFLFTRAAFGAGAGLIMFYFLLSGIVEGAIFPEFNKEIPKANLDQLVLDDIEKAEGVIGSLVNPASGMAGLILYCFVAGFSEKLIIGLLWQVENKTFSKQKPGATPTGSEKKPRQSSEKHASGQKVVAGSEEPTDEPEKAKLKKPDEQNKTVIRSESPPLESNEMRASKTPGISGTGDLETKRKPLTNTGTDGSNDTAHLVNLGDSHVKR